MTLSEKWNINEDWTLFLDRDGVLNVRLIDDYVKDVAEFVFLDGVLLSLAQLAEQFKTIVVVTNQQGIGKKLMTSDDLDKIHANMLAQIERAGGRIDAVYYCPHLSTEQSSLRKPQIGMAQLAKQDFKHIEFSKSIMVGDSKSDMEFGRNAGMKNVFVQTNNEMIDKSLYDLQVQNLHEFVKLV